MANSCCIFEYKGHKYAIAQITTDWGWLTDYDRKFYTDQDGSGKRVRSENEFRVENFNWTGITQFGVAVAEAKKFIDSKLQEEPMFPAAVYAYRGHKYAIGFFCNEYVWLTDYHSEFWWAYYDREKRRMKTTEEFSLKDFEHTEAKTREAALQAATELIDSRILEEEDDSYLAIDQSIYDDKDDSQETEHDYKDLSEENEAQYKILHEGWHVGHKYMVVEDTHNSSIGYATDFECVDIRQAAPDFSKFNFTDAVTEEQAIRAARTEIDNWMNSATNSKLKEEVSMGVQEEKEVIEAKRVMSWVIIKLTKSIEDLRELCKHKDWDDEITYDMEEIKTKLGECLADLTVWDEESFEKGTTND